MPTAARQGRCVCCVEVRRISSHIKFSSALSHWKLHLKIYTNTQAESYWTQYLFLTWHNIPTSQDMQDPEEFKSLSYLWEKEWTIKENEVDLIILPCLHRISMLVGCSFGLLSTLLWGNSNNFGIKSNRQVLRTKPVFYISYSQYMHGENY